MASAVAAPLPTAQAGAKLAADNADSGESVESSADTEEGATPLMYASQQGKDTTVQQMLAAEVGCAMLRDRTGKTALHYCCEQAGPSTAALLMAAAPSLLDAKDQDGYAPLTLAVIAGNRTLVRYLLARGADVNTADAEQHSVVHWATVCGDAASLELVIGAGAAVSTPDLHGGYPIHYAAQLCGPQGAAATIAENGTAVSRSVTDKGAGLAVLRTLLAAGASVAVRDHDGRQPLLWAASAGSADAILALVNAGADIEAEDKDGLTALHCAASRGHTDCVETLVSLCGAHVDVIDSNGCTALFYAVTLGHADATRLLLRRGAEPNRQDRKGRTAAHCGAAKGQLETLRILAAHSANLWLRNVRGDFPLHDAVQSGRTHLVQWLLSLKSGRGDGNQGTSVLPTSAADATNNDGRTPLHLAALHNNVEICKILLDARCLLNPTMRTNRHQLLTPLDAALLRGNRGCAKFLQLHGGVPASRLTESLGRLRASGRSLPIKQAESLSPDLSPERSSAQHSRTIQVHMKDDVGAPVVVYHHLSKSAPGSDGDCVNVCNQHTHCYKRSMRGRSHSDVQRWRRRERQAKRREARYRDAEASSCSEDEDDDGNGRSGVENSHKSTLSEGDSPVRVRTRTSFVRVGRGDYTRHSEGETAGRHHGGSRPERTTRRDSSNRKPRRGEKYSRSVRTSNRSNDNALNSDTSHNRHRNASFGDGDRPASKTSRRRLKERDIEEKDYSNDSSGREQVTKSECETRAPRSSRRDVPKSGRDRRRDTRRRKRSISNERESNREETIVSKRTTIQTVARTTESKHDQHEDNVTNIEAQSPNMDAQSAKDSQNAEKRSSRNTHEKTKSSKAPKTNVSPQIDVKVESETVVNTQKSASVSKPKSKQPKTETETQESAPPPKTESTSTEEEADLAPTQASDKEVATETLVTAVVHRENVATSSGPSHDDSNEINEEANQTSQVDDPNQNTVSEESPPQQEPSDEAADHTQELTQESEMIEEESQTVSQEAEVDRSEDISEQVTQSHSLETASELIEEAVAMEVQPDLSEGVDKDVEELQPSKEAPDEETTLEVDTRDHTSSGVLTEKSPQRDTKKSDDNTQVQGPPAQPPATTERQSKRLPSTTSKPTQKESLKREITQQPSFDKKGAQSERRVESKESSLERAKNYAANLRKEKTTSRQSKRTITSKTRSQYSSKRQNGRTTTRTTVVSTSEAPVIPIDVDDEDRQSPELSGRSPNDQLVDSGLEPSPRRGDLSDKEAQSDASLDAEPAPNREHRRRAHVKTTSKFDSLEQEEPLHDDAIEGNLKDGAEVSVTRAVQISMRKYHLERRIFHELLELKRLQIRAGRANEQVLVKRLVDDYRRAGLCVGLQQYTGTYTFRSFEKYLYEQLRALQAAGQQVVPRLQSSDDLERLMAALRRTRARHGSPPDDPLLCTLSTHRCHHALHAYSGVPCAAYIPKMNHHTIPKEDLENPGAHARAHAKSRSRSNVSFLPLIDGRQTEVGRFSRLLDSSRPVTLQLSHGQEKQVISLPTERLDKNKRYYVTFTIKGGSPAATAETHSGDPSAGPASQNVTKHAEDPRPQDSQSAASKSQRHGKSF